LSLGTGGPEFHNDRRAVHIGHKIVMAKGAVLRVHIDDPQKLLKQVTGPVDFDFEVHILTGKGLHYSAPIQSSIAGGRDHAITIPFGCPVTLRTAGAHFVVNDASGKPLSAEGMAINVPAGTVPSTIGLAIAGNK